MIFDRSGLVKIKINNFVFSRFGPSLTAPRCIGDTVTVFLPRGLALAKVVQIEPKGKRARGRGAKQSHLPIITTLHC